MASLTAADQTVAFSGVVLNKGEIATVALSGTYAATVVLQREVGSPGSGQWEDLKIWNTANATVSFAWQVQRTAENLRLFVRSYTSGTVVATLTDSTDQHLFEFKDPQGNLLGFFTQKGLELSGNLRSFIGSGEGLGRSYQIIAAITLTRELHAGKTGIFNIAAGVTATLPASIGDGSEYSFFVATTVTSVNDIVQVANVTDIIQGAVGLTTDIAGSSMPTTGTSDTITMNGTTTGGVKGTWFTLKDIAAGIFALTGNIVCTGVEATPFSAAV